MICNLLADSKVIAPAFQTELLLSAAESILSSFSILGQSDVGVRTAVRLLLPHAPPKRIHDEIYYEPRIAATISGTISHRFPDSDAEAHNLLNLTEELIRLGSARIAYACESLVFCRASFHASKEDLSKQVYWLLRGIEIMTVWLPEEYRRTLGYASRRHFDVMCEQSADDLLSCLSATQCSLGGDAEKLMEEIFLSLKRAKIILEVVLRDDSMADALKDNIEVALLYHIAGVADQQVEDDQSAMAAHIIHCLEERSCGGSVTTLANPKMYLRLLQIATSILGDEDAMIDGSTASKSCAFPVNGLHILMMRMDQVLCWEDKTSDSMECLAAMRMILCRGLMRAFASDSNEMLRKDTNVIVSLDEEVAMILSPSV